MTLNPPTRLFCALLFGLLLIDGLAAQVDSRTRPEGSPLEVSVQGLLIDLFKVDDAAGVASLDFSVLMHWHDPRQKAAPGEVVKLRPHEVWWPNVRITNDRGLETRIEKLIRVQDDGTCDYRQRYLGQVTTGFDYHDFPRDEHSLTIHFVLPTASTEDLRFIPDHSLIGTLGEVGMPGWQVGEVDLRPKELSVFGETYPGFVLEVSLARDFGYYFWKVLLPLALVVFMSWTVFWLAPAQAAPQVGLSATSILTLVAYRFALAYIMPQVSFLTWLDVFMLGSSLLVFAALLEAVVTTQLSVRDKDRLALRIDRTARWAFPLAFAGLCIICFWA